ncbi:MAG: hypothetical protein JXR91_13310 [Deltaproteobacteria bacterium]|nr:hypothetical protein [Deltaproteobacteria bacterium]
MSIGRRLSWVSYLVEKGARLDIKDNDGLTPAQLATKTERSVETILPE